MASALEPFNRQVNKVGTVKLIRTLTSQTFILASLLARVQSNQMCFQTLANCAGGRYVQQVHALVSFQEVRLHPLWRVMGEADLVDEQAFFENLDWPS